MNEQTKTDNTPIDGYLAVNGRVSDWPISGSQNWTRTGYDFKNRKGIWKPVFYIKQTQFDKSKRIGIKQAIELIKSGFFSITDDMRKWLDENNFADVKRVS